MASYFQLSRGVTDAPQKVKSFDEAYNVKPPRVPQPDRSWTYYERLPENGVFQSQQSDFASLGIFDELEEQDAAMQQERIQQILRRQAGTVGAPRREPPSLGRVEHESRQLGVNAAT